MHFTRPEQNGCNAFRASRVVALNEHVVRIDANDRMIAYFLDHSIQRAGYGAEVLVAGQPVQGGHESVAILRSRYLVEFQG